MSRRRFAASRRRASSRGSRPRTAPPSAGGEASRTERSLRTSGILTPMESLEGAARPAIEPATAAPPTFPALPRISAARRTLIANSMLGGMLVAGFLMAAGAAAKHYGPTLHIHHGLPSALRGP